MTSQAFHNLIFDLDGTLVDSLPGIEASTRHAMRAAGVNLPLPPMRELVGPPIATMLARLWPDLERERLDQVVREFRRHYDAEGCLCAELYPGVAESIPALRDAGLRLFLLTNKPLQPTLKILDHHGLRACFLDVMTPDAVEPPFTHKHAGAALLAERHGLHAAATLLAGDGLDDLEAATMHGFSFISADYGYGSAARSQSPKILASATSFPYICQIALGTHSTLL